MKTTKYVLLIIGILGTIASAIRIVQDAPLADVILGFITSIALIYGYFGIDRVEDKKKQ